MRRRRPLAPPCARRISASGSPIAGGAIGRRCAISRSASPHRASGLADYDYPILKSFEAVRAAGREFGAAHPGYVEAAIEAGSPDDLTLFSYTSGTTTRPKGVMLSHANLLSPAEAFATAEGLRASD